MKALLVAGLLVVLAIVVIEVVRTQPDNPDAPADGTATRDVADEPLPIDDQYADSDELDLELDLQLDDTDRRNDP